MKNKSLLILILLPLFACEKQDQTQFKTGYLSRSIGARITPEEAKRWSQRALTNAREESTPVTISKASLVTVTSVIPDYDGIVFLHAMENETHHIIVLPFKNGRDFETPTTVIDSNTDAEVEHALAIQWSVTFKERNPQSRWAHMFGRNVIEQILANEAFEKIDLVDGIDDSNEKVLLLYVWNTLGADNGRTQDELEVYDKSHCCPTD